MQQSASARRAAIALARAQLSMLDMHKERQSERETIAEAARMRSAAGTVVAPASGGASGSKTWTDTDVRQSAAGAAI